MQFIWNNKLHSWKMMDININFVKPHVVRDIWRDSSIDDQYTFLQDLLSYKKYLLLKWTCLYTSINSYKIRLPSTIISSIFTPLEEWTPSSNNVPLSSVIWRWFWWRMIRNIYANSVPKFGWKQLHIANFE